MDVMLRFAGALAVFLVMAGSGCGSNNVTKSSHLTCTRSVAEVCTLLGGCPMTWDELQSGQASCLHVSAYLDADHCAVGTCGDYREAAFFVTGVGPTLYYDATTGQLAAVITVGDVPPIQPSCAGGPPEGFTVPSCPPLDGGSVYLNCGTDAGI